MIPKVTKNWKGYTTDRTLQIILASEEMVDGETRLVRTCLGPQDKSATTQSLQYAKRKGRLKATVVVRGLQIYLQKGKPKTI